LGAVIPDEWRLARELTDHLKDLVVVLLLLAFFASIGSPKAAKSPGFEIHPMVSPA
jgi:hypothetical protein